jgi:radical SAM protein with 4Fe4S-binding SPASM domain
MDLRMRLFNRAKLLWSYLRRSERVPALPVEYIVETTAKCNLYCPMCPRETHKQPKEDMTDAIFEKLVQGAASTGEHMMLIGLGEPFMDRKDFRSHRVLRATRSRDSALDQRDIPRRKNGRPSARLALQHITLSFDGASEGDLRALSKRRALRKSPRQFRALRPHEKGTSRPHSNRCADGSDGGQRTRRWVIFKKFWSAVPGCRPGAREGRRDQLGDSEIERTGPAARACHYLWRGAMYVKHDGRVFPCCQSYMLDGAPVGHLAEQALPEIFNSDEMRRLRRLHAAGRAGEIDMCARCCTAIPHPLLVAGSLLLHGKWVRRAMPVIERLVYGSKLPQGLLASPRKELVQIGGAPAAKE